MMGAHNIRRSHGEAVTFCYPGEKPERSGMINKLKCPVEFKYISRV
jgi:hypothetical protein